MVRILGIDPGSRLMGYGMVGIPSGGRFVVEYIECGVLAAPADAPLEARLAEISRGLAEVIQELRPQVVAVEDIFHGANARSALALGHARGAALAVIGMAGLSVFAYSPAVVKKAVTGSGRASKEQVAEMVRVIVRLKRVPRADAADALAVAVAHAQMRPVVTLQGVA